MRVMSTNSKKSHQKEPDKTKKVRMRKCLSPKNPQREDALPPLDFKFKTKTQLDMDPHYYSLVDGRPIKQNQSIRVYKDNIRKVTVSRVTRGFILEEIMRINKEIETEMIAYDVASKHFTEYKNSFEKFLAHDNNETMKVIKLCDHTAKELALQNDLHKKLNFEMATLRSKLQYIDESRLILLSYEGFLHKISPLWWQTEHRITKCDESPKPLIVITSDIFCAMNPDHIQRRLDDRLPPTLFFETPGQLPLVFEMLEKQNLNYLLMTEEMNAQLMKVFRATEYFKHSWKKEIQFIHGQVDNIENAIKLKDSREQELKEIFFKILNEKLEHLIASETALQLYYYVEYVYEHVLSKNDIHDSTVNMVQALEKEYNNMMYELDGLDLGIVKEIEKETFKEDIKMLQEAENSKKLLKNFDKIRKRLSAAYHPNERDPQKKLP